MLLKEPGDLLLQQRDSGNGILEELPLSLGGTAGYGAHDLLLA
jgi:hypothetical protein